MKTTGWTIEEWRRASGDEALDPRNLLDLLDSIDRADAAWISVVTLVGLSAQLEGLEARRRALGGSSAQLPLYGVPFAVKDNIDALGFATTAACPEFSYEPREDALVVERLRAAGAILIGKTNLDQFATGLVGTRSPYGIVPSEFDEAFIGGGSSSGSAAVVSRGSLPFALGTDTAGSGRVPAALQNIVGIKPTCGRVSTRGVVPACKTLDCVSVFALTVDDGAYVAGLLEGYDARDPQARRPLPVVAPRPEQAVRLAVPAALEFDEDEAARAAFAATIGQLSELEISWVPIDFSPFAALARLLYEGPWVAERLLVVEDLLAQKPEALDPVVRSIVEQGASYSALDAFTFEYRRAELSRAIDDALEGVDALIVPTTPTIYRIEDVLAAPVLTNTKLGTYTNFTNLADLCGVALPGCFRSDGLPAGITLLGRAWQDAHLAELGRRFQAALRVPLGAVGRPLVTGPRRPALQAQETMPLAVLGAHLEGMPLNGQLTSRGAQLIEVTRTSERYRLYALPGTNPIKPGLVRREDGASLEVELWSLPSTQWASFLAEVRSPLAIGTVELHDGRWVAGFVCEPYGLHEALDITEWGGYRAYLATLA